MKMKAFSRAPAFLAAVTLLSLACASGSSSAQWAPDINKGAFAQPPAGPPVPLNTERGGNTDEDTIDINKASTDSELITAAQIYLERRDFNKAAKAYQRLIEAFPLSRFKNTAYYGLSYSRYREGHLKEARSMLEGLMSALEMGWDSSLKARAQAFIKEMDSVENSGKARPDSFAIGALLPTSGGYAQYGEAALRGILLAADVYGGGAPVEVYVREAGDSALPIEAAVKELSGNQRVAGVVGPLLSSTAYQAAEYAQSSGMPLITLSQKEGVTSAGDYIFRNSLLPESQASAVAEYACKKLGNKRFAVIYPQNNYGTELAVLFKKEVRRLGGIVVAEASYDEGTTDFGDVLRSVFNVTTKKKKEGRKTIKEYTPAANVDALYIPDYYETVSLIVPYLEYFNIKGVQLLGSNGWNSNRLVESVGKEIEGAVFVDGFFTESGRAGSKEFIERFKAAYGRNPGVLEAASYDAARILISAAAGASGKEFKAANREELKNRLKKLKGFRGAAGAVSFDTGGEAVKELFVLTVRGGHIAEAEAPH